MPPFRSLLLFQCPWLYNADSLPGRCLLLPFQSHQPLWPFIAFRAEATFLSPPSPHLMALSQQPSGCSAFFWFCPGQMHTPPPRTPSKAQLFFLDGALESFACQGSSPVLPPISAVPLAPSLLAKLTSIPQAWSQACIPQLCQLF